MTDQPNQSAMLGCQHQNTQFVKSGSSFGANDYGTERHEVRVCRDCGQIRITAVRNGVSFQLNFHIHDHETLALIGKYPTRVQPNEKQTFPTNDELIALAKTFFQETAYNLFDWIAIKFRQGGWENRAIERQLQRMEFQLDDLIHQDGWQPGVEETESQ